MDGFAFLLVIGSLLLFFIYWNLKEERKQSLSKMKLTDDGYKYIFNGGGDNFIAFNVKRGKFRFGSLSKYRYVERPISYLQNYEWKWIINNEARKTSNKFLFYIADVDYYMHEVFYSAQERLAEIEWAKLQAIAAECGSAQYAEVVPPAIPACTYDFFISHASEDKNDFVRPLAHALSNLGLNVWYDEFSLEIGDSLREAIDRGLAHSKYGIVVLSKAFFEKPWAQYELDALVNKSMNGRKVILPIWHNVDQQEVSQYSHNLAGRLALSSSSKSIESIAEQFLVLINKYN